MAEHNNDDTRYETVAPIGKVAELRQLLSGGAPTRPDPRRPGFYEVEGRAYTYYVFKYPSGTKVLLIAVWERDPVAEMVACSCPAA